MNKPKLSQPLITILIPCRNEINTIERLLSSILESQTLDCEYEVIIIDGFSNDGTREVITHWKKKYSNLILLDNPLLIVPCALNIGIKAAKGEWIMRLDAHATYDQNYFKFCIGSARQTHADNVGGIIITKTLEASFQGALVRAITTHKFGVGNSEFRIGLKEGPVDTVPFGCFRTKVFEKIGFFDERLIRNQDYELNRRLVKSGGKIWCNPNIKTTYYNQSTLAGLFQQAFQTGKWNPWMWFLAPYTFSFRHAIPGAFVLALVICPGLSFINSYGGFLLMGILIPYILIDWYVSIVQSRKYRWNLFLALPIMFFIYHISYGLGTVKGLLALLLKQSSIQKQREPWAGYGQYRIATQRTNETSN